MDDHAAAAKALLAAPCAYWVEIQHPGSTDWNHIHCPDWETTDSLGDAWDYAVQVRDDHPGSEVRMVERIDGYPDHYSRVPQ